MKTITMNVEFTLVVPDDTDVDSLYVEFHSGYDVLSFQTSPHCPVEAEVLSHETTAVDVISDDTD